MPNLTKPQTKHPLNSLILQPGIAIEHLVKQGVAMPIVEAVSLPDPNENRVVVTYHSYGQGADTQMVELTLEDFLRPFMQLRLTKAQDYDCLPAGDDAVEIVGRLQSASRYQVERRSVDGCVHLHCPCQHAEAQREALPAFPVLWQLLGAQAHCKHTVKAALDWDIDLEGFRFSEG